VSWNPFVKSNASAVTTTITSTRSLSIVLFLAATAVGAARAVVP
jgi:hypothetical protein